MAEQSHLKVLTRWVTLQRMFLKYRINDSNHELSYIRCNQCSENSIEVVSSLTMIVNALIAVVAMANIIIMPEGHHAEGNR